MDFSASWISLKKSPFWDEHNQEPINTSGFGHVDWIQQHAMINNRIRKLVFLETPINSYQQ